MSNRLERLHSQCRSYHLKKALKVFGLLLALVSLPFSGYYIYDFFEQEAVSVEKSLAVVQTEAAAIVTPPEHNETTPSQLLVLSVVPEKTLEQVAPKKTAAPVPAIEKPQVKHLVQISEKKAVLEVNTKSEKIYFSAINEDKPIQDWIEKYNKKKSYRVAIYIAKQYYSNDEFKNAGIWAKRANQLDRDKEDAWLLYAKSVYALGDKEKAKKILNVYLQYKESAKTELLLSEWEN